MFDRRCGMPDTDTEMQEVMRKAFEKPCEDTIFQLAAVTEAKSYKQGFQDCLELIKELFYK